MYPVKSCVFEVHGTKESQPWVWGWGVVKQWGFGFGLKLKNHKIHCEVLRLLLGGWEESPVIYTLAVT